MSNAFHLAGSLSTPSGIEARPESVVTSAPRSRAWLAPGTPLEALSIEAELLVLTAGGAANDARLLELLGRPIDWDYLLACATRQWAVTEVVRRLLAVTGGSLPDAAGRMRQVARVAEFQTRNLVGALQPLLGTLHERGIEVLLLKGAGLAHTAYESPWHRAMGDIDLLTRPAETRQAWQAALDDGWVRRGGVPSDLHYETHHHLPPLEDRGGIGVGLEVHADLFTRQAPFRLRAERVWASARRITVGGHPALVPSVHHQLMHACTHFAWSHELRFGAWRTFRDVEVIVQGGAVDWATFCREAADCRTASSCYWSLRLARDLAGSPVPDAVLDRLRPGLPRRVLDTLARHFALQLFHATGPRPSVGLSRRMWELGIRPGAQHHGRSRPWLDSGDRSGPGAGSGSAAHQSLLRRVRRELEYLSLLVAPTRPSTTRAPR